MCHIISMLDLEITEINDAQAQGAKILASNLSNPQSRKKGLIDILGINCAIGYLQSKHIKIDTKKSVYKIAPLFEEFGICDIYHGSYRIDVVTLYQEKTVKIPRFCADINIMPHFYFIVQIGSKIKEAKMIGFIDAKSVLDSTSDSKFFYPSLDCVFDVQKFANSTRRPIINKTVLGKHVDCLSLFLKFIDNDLPTTYKKQMIQHLMTCESCKTRFIDSIEFDRVSKSAKKYPSLIRRYVKEASKESEENYATNSISDFEKSIESVSFGVSDFKKEQTSLDEPVLDLEEIQKLDRGQLSKRFIETIFNDMPKIEISTLKTLVSTRSKRAILILIVSLFVLSSFALIAVKDRNSIEKENEQIQNFEDNEEIFNEEDDYIPGEAKLIPKQRDINDFIIKQPVTTAPVYSPNVNRVSWEAGESLVKDANYTKFLQLAGKNIKLNLQNDLLLVNDVPTSRIVKIDIKLGQNVDSNYIKISQSSGSEIIDNTIKKVINDTLKYMKPPSHGILSRSNDVTLTIELN